MNKYITQILLAALTLLFGGCSGDDAPILDIPQGQGDITISEDSQGVTLEPDGKSASARFSSRGGMAIVKIITNSPDWEMEVQGGWFNTEQFADGVVIEVDSNEDTESLEGSIVIKARNIDAGVSSVVINITQNGKGGEGIYVSTNEVILTAGGQYPQVVDIMTDDDEWDFVVESTWLLAEREGNAIKFTAKPNEKIEERSVNVDVVIMDKQGETVTESIMVFQEAKAYINADPYRIFSYYETGGTTTLQVNTNQKIWEAVIPLTEDWIIVTQEDKNLTITLKENTDNDSRSFVVELKAGELDNIATNEIIVSQVGKDPEAMVLEYTVEPDERGKLLDVILPLDGEVQCVVDWGDGTIEEISAPQPTHAYPDPGKYYVIIKGRMTHMNQRPMQPEERDLVTGVMRWGKTGLLDMNGALYYARKATQLPDDTEGSFSEVTSFKEAFSGMYELEVLPKGLFNYASKATNFDNLFIGHRKLKEIPEGFLDGCVSMTSLFYGLGNSIAYDTALEKIPGNLFKNCKNLTAIQYVFANQPNLTEIPEDIFASLSQVTTMTGVFDGTGITQIPENLFKDCTALKQLTTVFARTPIKTVPEKLFANNPNIEEFTSTFLGCESLETVPATLFANNLKAYRFYYTFKNTGLREVPAGLFDNVMPETTTNNTFAEVFSGCVNLRSVPADLFKNCVNAKNYSKSFYGCTSLEAIPSGTFFNGMEKVTFTDVFGGCTQLKTVGAGVFDALTEVTSFSGLFSGCTSLESIPVGLFDKNVNVTTFANAFANCENLESLPAGLFANNMAVTNFSGTFKGCGSLQQIPTGLFKSLSKITTFNNVFRDCTSLAAIPSDIFEGCTAVTNFSYAFYNCSALSVVPPNLFKDLSKVTNFSYLFSGASGLTTIESGVFDGCTGVTNFGYAFQDCSKLTTIPGGLFKNLSKVTDFQYLFSGAKSLESIPADLFEGCTATGNLRYAFNECSSLKTIPTSLFDSQTQAYNFNFTFNGCSSLRGESPYTIIDGVNVHLYERENHADKFRKPTVTASCFNGCTGLSDYDKIPTAWK